MPPHLPYGAGPAPLQQAVGALPSAPPAAPAPVPDPAPVRAAAGVIAEAMRQGEGTALALARSEYAAGLLFDPQRAQDIAEAAREQARAECAAELAQAQQDRQSLAWFHARWRAVAQLCEGRHPQDLLSVAEVLAATDASAPTTAPLTVTWDGTVAGPAGDHPHEPTYVACKTARGGRAVLVLDQQQRLRLGDLLLAVLQPAETCTTPGCGASAAELDESDPAMWGWIHLDVAGTDTGGRWWCSPMCVYAALVAARAELAAGADQRTTLDPDTQIPFVPTPLAGQDEVAQCVRCGCTEDKACPGGCHWVPNAQMIDLCSRCATPQEIAQAGGAW
ncbi:hypothetical protein GCM10010389_17920 [Streptomyces echinoruber]|uniref:Uncharacterized protein n=2 Tax=Streptomyces echinoruber TaxID=68898 RepID=A0A918QZU7_9ACTN|nr:hypothetical protein GCM10010389_17920 [Streptomyces echinoruber]